VWADPLDEQAARMERLAERVRFLEGRLARTAQPVWVNATYQNAWTTWGAGYYPLQYTKVNGQVFVRGTIRSGTFGTACATLPAGFRPGSGIQPMIRLDAGSGYMNVDSTGAMVPNQVIVGTGAPTAVSVLFDFWAEG
jgi:hypothetical protein